MVSSTNLIAGLGIHIVFPIHQTKCFIHNHCDVKYNFINNKFCGGGRVVTFFLAHCIKDGKIELQTLIQSFFMLGGSVTETTSERVVTLNRNPKEPDMMGKLALGLDVLYVFSQGEKPRECRDKSILASW
ncbi:MAG: hypothetical protein U9Q68_04655 [Euryarchaeota archaeon]|nr:hypothetical protein [Euryarchaeota archaeon]